MGVLETWLVSSLGCALFGVDKGEWLLDALTEAGAVATSVTVY